VRRRPAVSPRAMHFHTIIGMSGKPCESPPNSSEATLGRPPAVLATSAEPFGLRFIGACPVELPERLEGEAPRGVGFGESLVDLG
jgi:hypothetical protein